MLARKFLHFNYRFSILANNWSHYLRVILERTACWFDYFSSSYTWLMTFAGTSEFSGCFCVHACKHFALKVSSLDESFYDWAWAFPPLLRSKSIYFPCFFAAFYLLIIWFYGYWTSIYCCTFTCFFATYYLELLWSFGLTTLFYSYLVSYIF